MTTNLTLRAIIDAHLALAAPRLHVPSLTRIRPWQQHRDRIHSGGAPPVRRSCRTARLRVRAAVVAWHDGDECINAPPTPPPPPAPDFTDAFFASLFALPLFALPTSTDAAHPPPHPPPLRLPSRHRRIADACRLAHTTLHPPRRVAGPRRPPPPPLPASTHAVASRTDPRCKPPYLTLP